MIVSHKVANFLAHPLVLLVIATALSTAIVPCISSQLSRTKLIREESQKEATKIIQQSSDVNRDLNSMEVTLEFFYKNNRQPPLHIPAYYRKQQQKTLGEMEAQYRAFDRLAWWWPRDLYWEADFLGFMPQKTIKHIEKYGDTYDANLHDSMTVLNTLWTDLLRKPFDPRNPATENEVKATRDKLSQLQFARNELTSRFVHVFIPW